MKAFKARHRLARSLIALALVSLSAVSLAATTCAEVPGNPAISSARLEQLVVRYAQGDASAPPAFMGTVLVASGDEVLLNKGYGEANVSWSIPNAPDVRYRLGSITKQFTATLVLLLQQEGKLQLQDPVGKYLPDAPPHWRDITLSELLHHTSGIADFVSFPEYGNWRLTAHSHEDALAFFRDHPLDFQPGTQFEYSNSNYEVLGVVIERVSGKSYAQLLQDRVFRPLHMDATGLDADGLIVPKRAQGYQRGEEGALVRARSSSMSVPWAAGAMYSTTGDLLRWEHALFGGQVLSGRSLEAMTTPGLGGYGLGVRVSEQAGTKVIAHAGGIEGFNSYLAYVPSTKAAVVVLGNLNGKAPATIGRQLVAVMLGGACGNQGPEARGGAVGER